MLSYNTFSPLMQIRVQYDQKTDYPTHREEQGQ